MNYTYRVTFTHGGQQHRRSRTSHITIPNPKAGRVQLAIAILQRWPYTGVAVTAKKRVGS